MTSQPGWRTGVVKFKADQTKPGVSLGRADADALLGLAENGRPREVFGHRRYLREFLPKDVDFAFIWTWHDSVDVTSAGNNRMRTSRRLCVNRRARELLIEAKLVPAQGFQPLCVLDEAPQGATVLDRRGDPGPGPLVSAEWLARLREEESAGLKAFHAKPKPPRPTSLANSLKVLKAVKRADPKSFAKGASAKQLDQLAAALAPGLPDAWRKVLALSNGFSLEQAAATDGAAVRFSAAKALPGEQDDHAPFLKELYGAEAKRMLYIGDTYHGDLFVLRTDALDKSGDCPAVLVNHESGGDLVTWPSVAAMLDDLLQ
jgi:hypothetical protein